MDRHFFGKGNRMTALLVFVGIAVLVLLYAISIYNRLVTLRNQFKNSFAQIEVQLKRRYDLIPNLVETVKGYMEHEKETYERVIGRGTRRFQV